VPREQAGAAGGQQWPGPACTTATLCPGVGKGEEENRDDGRSEEERRWGR